MKKIKTHRDKLINLYETNKAMLKQIENLVFNEDCPGKIKYDVLKPIQSKLQWFNNALEIKLADHIDLKGYRSAYNETIILSEIMRNIMLLSSDQQEQLTRIVRGVQQGKIINLEVVEEQEEEIF